MFFVDLNKKIIMKIFQLIILLLIFPAFLNAQSVKCMNKPAWKFAFSKNWSYCSDNWILEKHGDNLQYKIFDKRGKLHIVVTRQQNPKQTTFLRIYTSSKYPILYGKVEVKAKFPINLGAGCSIWLRPKHGSNHLVAGEIDLIEWGDRFAQNVFQSNFHLWGNFNRKLNNHIQYPEKYENLNFKVNKYHVYSAEWDSKKLIIKVDNHIINIWYSRDYPLWPFNYGYELCLDNGYAGWDSIKKYEDEQVPIDFQIEWVKYYKLKE